MKNNLDKSELVTLDVFEIVDYKPVFKYKINVLDKFVILVSNNDVSKCINKQVNESLELYVLTKDEKSTLRIPLTHKFHLKQFSKQYLFLNLTNKDLINLGFKERTKTFWQKLFDFSVNGFWLWLERISFVIAVVTGLIVMFQFLSNSCKH